MGFSLWLQRNAFVVWVNGSVVTASSLEIIHYVGFFLLVGGRVRQNCDLAPVKESLPDAVVLLCLA